MKASFLERMLRLLPASERALVAARVPSLVTQARDWFAPIHAEAGPVLAERLAVTVAAIAPRLGDTEMSLFLRWCMWTFVIDGRLDSVDRPVDPAVQLASVRDVLAGGSGGGTDGFLERKLAETIEELRRRDAGRGLLDRFVESTADNVAAAVEHVQLCRQVAEGLIPAPCVEDYLLIASRHIYYRCLGIVLLAAIGEHPTGDDLDRLDRFLTAAATAVRLANDLRTCGRDAAEGMLNIVQLTSRAGVRMTPERVGELIDEHCAGAMDILRTVHNPGLAMSVEVLANNLRLAVGLYRINALRTDEPDPAESIGAPSS